MRFESPTAFLARDEFGQTVSGGADPLAGQTLPVGGTWAGAGDADDFVVEDTGHTAQRTAVSDTGPRFGLAGATTYAAIGVQATVQAEFYTASDTQRLGVVARYVSTSSRLAAAIYTDSAGSLLEVGGVPTLTNRYFALPFTPVAGGAYTIRLVADAAGRWWAWVWAGDVPGAPVASGYHEDLATGGASDDGQIGLLDHWSGSLSRTRNYDNFFAFAPTPDAACFA